MSLARPQSGRLQALDAWRGLCALAVAFFHLPVAHRLTGESPFANLQLCVDFFFVLSGFVINRTYGRKLVDLGDARRFVLTRFGRLWPLHAVVLALLLVLELIRLRASIASPAMAAMMQEPAFSAGRSIGELVTSSLFLQAFNIHATASWNFPAWSVAAEFYTYLVFALVCLSFSRLRTVIFAMIALFSAAILYRISPDTLFVSFDWGFLRCLMGFFVGCLVYRFSEIFPNPPRALSVLEFAISGSAIGYVLFSQEGTGHYAAPLVFAVLIYVFSFDRGAVSKMLKATPLQKLGLWSYSIYMVHVFLFQVTRSVVIYLSGKTGIGSFEIHHGTKMWVAGPSLIALVVSFVATIVLVVPVAALCYRWIERPCMDWFRAKAGNPMPKERSVLENGNVSREVS